MPTEVFTEVLMRTIFLTFPFCHLLIFDYYYLGLLGPPWHRTTIRLPLCGCVIHQLMDRACRGRQGLLVRFMSGSVSDRVGCWSGSDGEAVVIPTASAYSFC